MEPVAATHHVRRFNRTVTQRIGALQDGYLARGRPLGASRVLWEIGDDGADVRALRARLDLDSGYLSRLLRLLEREGLVVLEAGARDARVRTVRLTDAGRAERAVLDARSDELARSLLEPLTETQRERLVEAMRQVERLLVAGAVEIRVEAPTSPAAQHCVRSYFEELEARFEHGFDPARSVLPDIGELTGPAGLLLVARLHGEPIGCGGLRLFGGGLADVKRMWIAPAARGLGLGRRLLAELEAHARGHGVTTLRLETNRALTEAIALYRSSGYVEVAPFNDEPYADFWFAKELGSGSRTGPALHSAAVKSPLTP
jgi:DNA-binding MarR family transcriptional regulator/GNAT superfamily N-acetyltransferase